MQDVLPKPSDSVPVLHDALDTPLKEALAAWLLCFLKETYNCWELFEWRAFRHYLLTAQPALPACHYACVRNLSEAQLLSAIAQMISDGSLYYLAIGGAEYIAAGEPLVNIYAGQMADAMA